MNNNQGFTLVQTAVTVAVLGVLTVMAVPTYQYFSGKAQASELSTMLATEQLNALASLKKGKCPSVNAIGKYGSVTGAGSFVISKGASCPTGCELTYTFNADNAAKELQGKAAAVALLNNGKISLLAAKTTVPDKYLNGLVVSASNLTGDNCAPINPSNPSITDGNNAPGTEVGEIIPTDPDGSGTDPDGTDLDDGTDPDPAGEIIVTDKTPDGKICDDTYVPSLGETVIIIDSVGAYKTEPTHYIHGSINLLDLFNKKMGRAPKADEKVKFLTTCAVAIVGNSLSSWVQYPGKYQDPMINRGYHTPAMTVGDWPVSVSVSLRNFGVIVGRGGGGSTPGCYIFSDCRGGHDFTFSGLPRQAGTAIEGSASTPLNVDNFGVIAGGGGGGATGRGGVSTGGGGGGAPYGDPGGGFKKWGAAETGAFTSGGIGAHAGDGRRGGWGGEWGALGGAGDSVSQLAAGKAGFIKTNLVNIKNYNGGVTKGN